MSPAKTGGGGWDIGGRDASQAMGAIGDALRLPDPFPQIMAILSGPLVNGVERPEIFGNARLVTWQGDGSIISFSAQRDTLTPQFAPQPRFQIDLSGSTRIEVHLLDEDLEFHDPVGHFQIGANEARVALRANRIVPVRVAEQTSRQVLFVNISAFAVP
ncbi:MAG: hypothetical protein HOW73_40300 [Polyangiaceae bacterium]|nr:hypothetical protein [Polyangiaceae bacterium]